MFSSAIQVRATAGKIGLWNLIQSAWGSPRFLLGKPNTWLCPPFWWSHNKRNHYPPFPAWYVQTSSVSEEAPWILILHSVSLLWEQPQREHNRNSPDVREEVLLVFIILQFWMPRSRAFATMTVDEVVH